jgi:hypothetical protein
LQVGTTLVALMSMTRCQLSSEAAIGLRSSVAPTFVQDVDPPPPNGIGHLLTVDAVRRMPEIGTEVPGYDWDENGWTNGVTGAMVIGCKRMNQWHGARYLDASHNA